MHKPENRTIGVAGAKVMEYIENSTVQSAGGGTLIKPIAYSRLVGAGQTDIGQFDFDNIKMDFVAGTSMLVRKEFLKEVGLLNEDYFLYYEEPDWAERGKRLEWRMGYCFKAIVYHKGGSTTGGKGYTNIKDSTDVSDFYFQRAKILFTRKYYWYYLPILYLSFILVIFNRLRRRQFARIKFLIHILVNPTLRFDKL
jgi:GT2 family glycosyltransferase